jgi:MFS family permease
LLVFAGISFMVFLVSTQLVSALSVFTVDHLGFSTAQYGLLLTVNGLVVVIFQYPVARRIGRGARSAALVAGSLLYAVGYLSLGWFKTFDLAILSIVVVTAGEVIFSPATLSIVGELAPLEQRGRYMGFFGLNETLSMAIGPLIGGFLLDSFPSSAVSMWGIIASLAFVGAIGFILWSRSPRLIQAGLYKTIK